MWSVGSKVLVESAVLDPPWATDRLGGQVGRLALYGGCRGWNFSGEAHAPQGIDLERFRRQLSSSHVDVEG